jgi:acetate kinase
MVHVPENAPWVADWIEEHAVFPNGAYDDQVDTTSMALARLFAAQPEAEAWVIPTNEELMIARHTRRMLG